MVGVVVDVAGVVAHVFVVVVGFSVVVSVMISVAAVFVVVVRGVLL